MRKHSLLDIDCGDSVLDAARGAPCLVCRRPSDPCHVKSKGSGGPATTWNIMPLCRVHHTDQHALGWFRMATKYGQIAFWLRDNGWVFDKDLKIRNDRLLPYFVHSSNLDI